METQIELINSDLEKFIKIISIKDLIKILRYLSKYYYNKSESLVSDEIYDKLVDHLRTIDPNNSFFNEIGAPINSKNKIKLPYPMGSLDKIKPGSKLHQIELWLDKYNGPYIISDKLDGISVQLYKKDNDISLFTRGNGTEGRKINKLIKYIFKNSLEKIPNGMSIRGELIMKKKSFEKFKNEFKNARNLVAGVVNSDKKLKLEIINEIDFVAYNILYPEYLYLEQLERLEQLKFNVVVNKSITKNNFENNLKEYYLERKIKSEYEIDGIVVADNSKIYKLKSGNPDHMVAFKMDEGQDSAIVKVKSVDWQISMYGYLNPIIRIDPVELSGVTISNITGNNAKYIYDNNIGKNAEIKIIRSGDVIPKIVEIIKQAEKPDLSNYKTKWTETGVDLIIDEITPEIKKEIECAKSLHFFQTINVQYISEGIISKLYENGYKNIIQILSANKDDLVKINGIGNKLIDKIYDQIEKQIGGIKLYELMAGSTIFGRGLGVKKLKSIVKFYPDILDLELENDECIDMLLKIEGIGNIQATQFCNKLNKFRKFYEKIKNIYNIENINEERKIINNKLKGLNIVFSGFRNEELEKIIEENEGNVKTSVSKNTDILIYKEGIKSSKYTKAKELGIKLMTEDEFKKDLL